MTSNKSSIQQAKHHLERNFQNCRVRVVGGTDLAECLMEAIRCQWAMPFGDGNYCKHPSAKQFAIQDPS